MNKDFEKYAISNGISSARINQFENRYIEPTIIETNPHHMASMSVFSKLFTERILFLGCEIDSDVANIINSQLLYLAMTSDSPIKLYINSPGGSVYDGMSIYDTMKFIDCKVETTCIGTAASMGAVLLAGGEKGKRFSLPHSQILLHSPSGGTGLVTAPDFRIAAKEMEKCENMLYEVLAKDMGKDFDYVKKICDRDYWLTPEEAVKEGVIDKVIIY